MKSVILYILNILLPFGIGFSTYLLFVEITTGGALGYEALSFLFYGGIAYLFFGVPMYFSVISLFDLKKKVRAFYYPLGCIVVNLFPIFLLTSMFGIFNIFDPEFMGLHLIFLTTGLAFGSFNWIIKKVPKKIDI